MGELVYEDGTGGLCSVPWQEHQNRQGGTQLENPYSTYIPNTPQMPCALSSFPPQVPDGSQPSQYFVETTSLNPAPVCQGAQAVST